MVDSGHETALLFAGQGAQSVGMGKDLAGRWPAVGEMFRRADEILGTPLSRVIFEGPEEELTVTSNAQPAVVLVSLAAMRALELEGKLADFGAVAGLSLGEYAALAAAGSISFDDTVKLVRRRGELMQEASERNPGTMASVLMLDEDACRKACEEAKAETGGVVTVANLNSPGQVVISGELAAVEVAAKLCLEKGAKRVVPLKVAGAFHSPLMQPAADGLAQALRDVEIREPKVPVFQNCTAEATSKPDEIRSGLVRQMTSPVLWARSCSNMLVAGLKRFVELGPGKVLAGLMKRIDRKAEVTSVGTVEAVERASFEE